MKTRFKEQKSPNDNDNNLPPDDDVLPGTSRVDINHNFTATPTYVISDRSNNISNNNKQCGRRVRPTQYAPAPPPSVTPTFDCSKVGNLHSKFGHARPLGSRIICYVRNRQTDRRMDKINTHCPLRYSRRHNNNNGFVQHLQVRRYRGA